MEYFSLQALFTIAILLCVPFIIIVLTSKRKSPQLSLPPGKTGWPILGETLAFLLHGRRGQLDKFVDERRNKYAPQVFTTSLFGHNMAFFCDAPGHKFLYSNENKLVISWWPRTLNKLLISDPSVSDNSMAHNLKLARSVIIGFLKLEALQNYIPTMDLVARNQINDEWAPKREVVVLSLAQKYTFWLACRLLMGIDQPENVAALTNYFGAVLAGIFSVPIDFPGTTFNRAKKKARFLRKELLEIIRRKRMDLEAEGDKTVTNLIDHMLVTPDENGNFLSENAIADMIVGLLIGGYDTTATTITFTINYLAELPHVYQQVLKEHLEIAKSKGPKDLLNWADVQKMKYSWNVVCEVMRLAPPSQIAFKEVMVDFSYAGFAIPKGWKTCWSVHSTHKNPKYFPDPEKFDPTRFEGNGPAPYTYVPFGGGPRMCPGKEFARLEILVFMHNLVTRYKWEKLIPDEKTMFTPTPTPENGLPIRLLPHQSCSF